MSKEIRVINFVPGLGSGGVAVLMKEWYKRKNKNVIFDIAAISKGMAYDELIQNGCKIYDFSPITKVGMIKYIKQAYIIIKNGNYNVVHSHVGMISFFIFIAAIFARVKKRVLHAHGTKYNQDNGKIINSVITKILMKCSVITATDYLACSRDAARYLYGNVIANKKCIIINNGIDLKRFAFKEKTNKSKKTIGYVARIEKSKNHAFLLRVLKKIVDDGRDVELLLIGDGDPKEIIETAKNMGIENNINVLPAQKKIENQYYIMDVFTFPSLYEGLGIVSVEAQACGTPVLLSPGIPEEAIVSHIAKRLELNEDLWAKEIEMLFDHPLNDNVHSEIITAGFDINACTKELMSVYSGEIN